MNAVSKRNNRIYWFVIFSCTFLWTIMMGSKNVYTAEIVEIMGIFNVEKAQASFAMFLYFMVYSSVQIALFFFLEKLDLKWFTLITMGVSGLVTVFVAFATDMFQIWWLLAINGFLQAGVCGVCIATFKKFLPENKLAIANVFFNVGTAIAGLISYGTGALFVSISRWELPFIILGIVLSLSAVLYFVSIIMASKIKKDESEVLEENKLETEQALFAVKSKTFKIVYCVLTFVISFFIHAIFYPVLNWMPNLLTEIYSLDNSVAILISALAPVMTVIGPIIAVAQCERQKNFIMVTIIYMAITTVLGLLMWLIFDKSMLGIIIAIIVFLVVAQAAMTVVFTVMPLKMSAYVDAGGHSSLMNSAGGFAAGIAPMAIGSIIDSFGWAVSYGVIFGVSLAMLVVLFGVYIYIEKLRKKQAKQGN